jgi:hypothetical protein
MRREMHAMREEHRAKTQGRSVDMDVAIVMMDSDSPR